ncbi:MAG: hypothetical protein U0470_04715 [Anaerolineae bacterium]
MLPEQATLGGVAVGSGVAVGNGVAVLAGSEVFDRLDRNCSVEVLPAPQGVPRVP